MQLAALSAFAANFDPGLHCSCSLTPAAYLGCRTADHITPTCSKNVQGTDEGVLWVVQKAV
jgi:hypothetical protein